MPRYHVLPATQAAASHAVPAFCATCQLEERQDRLRQTQHPKPRTPIASRDAGLPEPVPRWQPRTPTRAIWHWRALVWPARIDQKGSSSSSLDIGFPALDTDRIKLRLKAKPQIPVFQIVFLFRIARKNPSPP